MKKKKFKLGSHRIQGAMITPEAKETFTRFAGYLTQRTGKSVSTTPAISMFLETVAKEMEDPETLAAYGDRVLSNIDAFDLDLEK